MDSNVSVLPCFKCGADITVEHESLIDAMTFTAHGGWGSMYDPMNSRVFLRIHICDVCVMAAAQKGMVLEGTRVPKPDDIRYRKWRVTDLEGSPDQE